MNRNLESLLRWSIENTPQQGNPSAAAASSSTAVTCVPSSDDQQQASTSSLPSAAPRLNKLDPAILDAILGRSDAQRMADCVKDLQDTDLDAETKHHRWDELEMLVESLDNANDLENMKLWTPIYDFLADPAENMRLQAAWVLGTAVQNNPRSQEAFLKLDPLPRVLDMLRSESSSSLRSKLMYLLSGLLRHNSSAVAKFSQLQGWSTLKESLAQDPSLPLRRKTAFLINSLFVHADSDADAQTYITAANQQGIIDALIDSLDKDSATPAGYDGEVEDIDEDYAEKAIHALISVTQRTGASAISKQQKQKLQRLVEQFDKDQRPVGFLAESEWADFKRILES